MKKTIILIAAACTLFAACSKDKMPRGNEFAAGEKVTICATTSSEGATKVNGLLNAQDKISFTWETGDKIKVIIGASSSEFTLIDGAGTASATFEGVMPADGNTFDVQFPTTDPVLASQDYVENGLPHNKIKATATGCTLGTNVNLVATNSALRLKLFGTDQTVGQLVITDLTATPNVIYTLNSPSAGVTIGETAGDATSFFAVLPAGSRKFNVDVYDNESPKGLICSYETSAAQTFTAGQVLVMPEKEVQAPFPKFSVSATKKVTFSPANLWWDGTNWHFEANQLVRTNSWQANHRSYFYYSSTVAGALSNSSPNPQVGDACCFGENQADFTVDGETGYFLLTKAEWNYLFGYGGGRSQSLRAGGVTINGLEHCFVIAPDGYKKTIKSTYTSDEWAEAEAEGLVCMTPCGRFYSSGRNVSDKDACNYLTATLENANMPEAIYCYTTPSVGHPMGAGYSFTVRLVRNYVAPTETGNGTLGSMSGSNGSW